MKEQVLIDFFRGRLDASELAADLEGAYVEEAQGVLALHAEAAGEPHLVRRSDLIRLLRAVLDGDIDPHLLEAAGDCLTMSETFHFDPTDAELLSDIAHQLGTPELGYPLDRPHIALFLGWLEDGV
ncbi:MAG: hypothetical protein RL885_29275 [Planctomycetota bacterium]